MAVVCFWALNFSLSQCQMILLFLFCLQAEEPQEEEEQAPEQTNIKEENRGTLYIYFTE